MSSHRCFLVYRTARTRHAGPGRRGAGFQEDFAHTPTFY
jgi:hypothetical protein